ncbi:MAG: NAD(P)/FAD-dependent oxidoreductase [Myxococcota bacterium]
MSGGGPDTAFFRRAAEVADLNALRTALYQTTHDAALLDFGPVAGLDEAEQARLRARCVELLDGDRSGWAPRVPDDDELLRLMDLTLGVPTKPGHFEIRKKFLNFEPYPFSFVPEGGKPDVPEGFEVAIIGAGFSGVAMAIQLDQLGVPYTIFERRGELGGTWSANQYPDIRVDTMTLTYELCLDRPHRWSEYFARGAEVRGYLKDVAERHGIAPKLRVDHALESARFDESSSRWSLGFSRSDGTQVTHEANVVVSAAGLFSTPTTPDLPGKESFEGEILHPTQWTSAHSASGKRVAVVGNGSTGVQLLSPIAEAADQTIVFQRTPQWISPRPGYGEPIGEEKRWLLEHLPGYWNWYRYSAIIGLFTWHEDFLLPDPEWEAQGGHITRKSEELQAMLLDYIKAKIGDRPDLLEKLVPNHAPMVRRPVVDNGWYEAITRDDVELVTEGIARFTPKGVETTDGKHYEVDLVVFATGYKVDHYLWPAEYEGEGGQNLRDYWAPESPRAYLGLMVPRFPNLFIMYGPNSQPASGGVSLTAWMQIWSAYAAQCLCRMFAEGHTKVGVKEEAFLEFNRKLDEEASGMAFLTDSGSVEKNYYVDGSGRLLVNTPFEVADLYPLMARPDPDELDFR